jgi:hypothetical protein
VLLCRRDNRTAIFGERLHVRFVTADANDHEEMRVLCARDGWNQKRRAANSN